MASISSCLRAGPARPWQPSCDHHPAPPTGIRSVLRISPRRGSCPIGATRRCPLVGYWAGSAAAVSPTPPTVTATYLAEPRRSIVYGGIRRFPGITVCGYHAGDRLYPEDASWHAGASVGETRMIAGRPARVIYSPPGTGQRDSFSVTVWVYDAATESEYKLIGEDDTLRGGNVDAVIAITRSLFESE